MSISASEFLKWLNVFRVPQGTTPINGIVNPGTAGQIAYYPGNGQAVSGLATPIAINKGGTAVTSVTITPTASAFAGWDANSNLSSVNLLNGYATTATAGATTTLAVGSKYQQYFTGSTTQTLVMPLASTLTLGQAWLVVNRSSGSVTVNSSGGNAIQVLTANTQLLITCILTSGTDASSWSVLYRPNSIPTTFVTSITGTANEIIASAATGAITLSLPQEIATSSTPTFAGANLGNILVTGNTLSSSNGNGPLIFKATGTGSYIFGQSTGTNPAGAFGALVFVGTPGTNSEIDNLNYVNSSSGFIQNFYKSRSTSIGSFTAVQTGDVLYGTTVLGDDGTQFKPATLMQVKAQGTISTGIVPGQYEWSTNNVSGVMTLGMTLSDAQILTLANPLPTGSGGTGVQSLDPGITYTGTYPDLIVVVTNISNGQANNSTNINALSSAVTAVAGTGPTTANFGTMGIVGGLTLSWTATTSITAASLVISNSAFTFTLPLLTTLSMDALKIITGNLTLTNANSLVTLSLPALQQLGSAVTLTSVTSLTTVNFPALVDYAGTWSGTANALTTFTLTNLVTAGSYTLTANALTTLSMPAVTTIGTFTPVGTLLATINMPLLTTMLNTFSPNLAALTTLTLTSLTSIAGSFGLTAATLTTLSLPALITLGGTWATTLASCTSVDLSSLVTVTGAITASFAALTTLSLPAIVTMSAAVTFTAANLVTFSMNAGLHTVGGNWTMTGMKLNQASVDGILVSLAALDGTGGTTAYSSKTVNLSGGTSSAPSATGIAAAVTLTGRGCTVTTN